MGGSTTGGVTASAQTDAPTLRLVRVMRGLSQAQLADRAGLSRSTVSRIETGAETPNLRTVRQLARALSWPADDLFALDHDDDRDAA